MVQLHRLVLMVLVYVKILSSIFRRGYEVGRGRVTMHKLLKIDLTCGDFTKKYNTVHLVKLKGSWRCKSLGRDVRLEKNANVLGLTV